jgi:hypothetical protein
MQTSVMTKHITQPRISQRVHFALLTDVAFGPASASSWLEIWLVGIMPVATSKEIHEASRVG